MEYVVVGVSTMNLSYDKFKYNPRHIYTVFQAVYE